MSIYVYITRRRNPIDDDSPNIAADEWLTAISGDTSFRQPSQAEIEPARPIQSHYSVWTGHPNGDEAWFTWTEGQIDVRNPDEPMIAVAMKLARHLNANVVSEMGEVFKEDGSHKGFVDGEPW